MHDYFKNALLYQYIAQRRPEGSLYTIDTHLWPRGPHSNSVGWEANDDCCIVFLINEFGLLCAHAEARRRLRKQIKFPLSLITTLDGPTDPAEESAAT